MVTCIFKRSNTTTVRVQPGAGYVRLATRTCDWFAAAVLRAAVFVSHKKTLENKHKKHIGVGEFCWTDATSATSAAAAAAAAATTVEPAHI